MQRIRTQIDEARSRSPIWQSETQPRPIRGLSYAINGPDIVRYYPNTYNSFDSEFQSFGELNRYRRPQHKSSILEHPSSKSDRGSFENKFNRRHSTRSCIVDSDCRKLCRSMQRLIRKNEPDCSLQSLCDNKSCKCHCADELLWEGIISLIADSNPFKA